MRETDRLILIPLTESQLHNWIYNLLALEQALDCTYGAEPMEGFFREIVAGQLEKLRQDSHNWVWHTFWLIIRKSDGTVVGSADYKGPPNAFGQVEIGYGLGEEYQHNGYMTEAARDMIIWAFSQPTVQTVLAETDLDGTASQAVLKRLGFVLDKIGETLWWKLDREAFL